MTTGPYGAEHAVVIPTNDQTMNMAANLIAVSEQRKRYEQARQNEERDRQDMLVQYLGKEFDEKNFATGTAADRIINESLRGLKEKFTGMVLKNPNARLADLSILIQKDVDQLNRYSVNAKSVRAMIDESTKGLEADKSIDINAIRSGAINKAFFKLNPATNTYEVRNPDEMDLSKDYVSEFMNERPDLWSRGRTGIDLWLADQKPVKAGNEITTDRAGKKVTKGWEADLLSFQDITSNKSGMPVGLAVKKQTVSMPDGSKMEVLDENVYQDMISKYRGASGYFDAQIMNHPALKNLDKNGTEWQVAKRRLAYEVLSDAPQNRAFRSKYVENEDSWLGKFQAFGAGVSMGSSGNKGQKGQKDEKSNPIEALIRVKMGDPNYIQGETTANGMIDITSRMPGATLYSGKTKLDRDKKAQPESYERVLFNPADGEIYVKDERSSRPQKIDNFNQWITTIAEANGVPIKSVEGIMSQYGTKGPSGYEYSWGNTMIPRNVLADNLARNYNNDLQNQLADFKKSKDPSVVAKIRGEVFDFKDGTSGKIEDPQYSPGNFISSEKIKFTSNGIPKSMSLSEFEQLISGLTMGKKK